MTDKKPDVTPRAQQSVKTMKKLSCFIWPLFKSIVKARRRECRTSYRIL